MVIKPHDMRPTWLVMAAAAALGVLAAAPARANLISPVTVSLVAPGGIVGNATPIDVTDSVATAVGINPGVGNVGANMLPGESILFSGDSIILHVAAGAGDAATNTPFTTGYLGSGGQHARYEFKNLHILNELIVGYAYAVPAGISGDNVSLISPNQINFDLDTLVFDTAQARHDANGYYFADFTINLITQPDTTPPTGNVPEPASWALVLGALAGLGAANRRRRA